MFALSVITTKMHLRRVYRCECLATLGCDKLIADEESCRLSIFDPIRRF